jgi:hypothetical protein
MPPTPTAQRSGLRATQGRAPASGHGRAPDPLRPPAQKRGTKRRDGIMDKGSTSSKRLCTLFLLAMLSGGALAHTVEPIAGPRRSAMARAWPAQLALGTRSLCKRRPRALATEPTRRACRCARKPSGRRRVAGGRKLKRARERAREAPLSLSLSRQPTTSARWAEPSRKLASAGGTRPDGGRS